MACSGVPNVMNDKGHLPTIGKIKAIKGIDRHTSLYNINI
jgi:hypothetical protein